MTTHVISIGGGITSSLLLPQLCIERYGRDKCVFVMAAVTEDKGSSKRFVEDVEKLLNIEITRVTIGGEILPRGVWAKYGIWDVFFYTGILGNSRIDPCSRMLKREVISAYMKQWHTPDDTVLHVGITAHEIDRMLAIVRNWKQQGYKVVADLADDPTINREFAIAESKRLLGYVPINYAIDMNHNNCGAGEDGVGFCVKGGQKEKAILLWYDRTTYLHHETRELQHQQIFGHSNTIMKRQRNGKTEYVTLRQFRLEMEMKWRGMLPGFDPFEGLEETPGCTFCESAA